MKRPALLIALAVALVVTSLGVVLALNVGNDPQTSSQHSNMLGKAAPGFNLPTLTGAKVSRDTLQGKTVIVNFWNTWCIPCQQELSELKQFYSQHANDPDFVLVGIVRDDPDTMVVREYVQGEGMGWTIALDPGDKAALDFATRGQPETYAISPQGRIVGTQIGPVSSSGLEAMLATSRAA